MIDWLRTRSPLLRYSVYVAAAVLMFLVAAGVGAIAAVLVGWQPGEAPIGSTGHGAADNGTTMSEGRDPETTGNAKASEDTADKARFVHHATDKNSRGDYTYISDPSINGHPNAIVFASPIADQKDEGASYGHNIGVWYEGAAHKWAIFNQDRAAVPVGAGFEVVVPKASAEFVHQADLLNTAGNYTYLDDRLTNGNPDASLSVTQNWNPGGGRGVYNNHPVAALYDAKVKQWAVYNRDGASIPAGAAFNIAVSAGSDAPSR